LRKKHSTADQKNSHDQSDEFELRKENKNQGDNRGVHEFSRWTVVEKVERPVDLEEIIGRDDIIF